MSERMVIRLDEASDGPIRLDFASVAGEDRGEDDLEDVSVSDIGTALDEESEPEPVAELEPVAEPAPESAAPVSGYVSALGSSGNTSIWDPASGGTSGFENGYDDATEEGEISISQAFRLALANQEEPDSGNSFEADSEIGEAFEQEPAFEEDLESSFELEPGSELESVSPFGFELESESDLELEAEPEPAFEPEPAPEYEPVFEPESAPEPEPAVPLEPYRVIEPKPSFGYELEPTPVPIPEPDPLSSYTPALQQVSPSMAESAYLPVDEPVSEPQYLSVAESMSRSDPEPAPTPAPAPEPIPEPASAPAPEPIPEPIPAPAPEPVEGYTPSLSLHTAAIPIAPPGNTATSQLSHRIAPSLDIGTDLKRASSLLRSIVDQVESVVFGRTDLVELAVLVMVARGHMLIEGPAGMGKTTLAETLAQVVSCDLRRVQLTPDVLPADIIGRLEFNPETSAFEYRPGSIMTNIVFADEIDRAAAKTQSALLEVMRTGRVAVGAQTYDLETPFFLIATQDRGEQFGTYPLSVSQAERFMVKAAIDYPKPDEEERIVAERKALQAPVSPVASRRDLIEIQELSDRIRIEEHIRRYIVEVVAATRNSPDIQIGASPRGSVALADLAQAYALYQGRGYVIPDDVKHLANYVLAHRIQLSHTALMAGRSAADVVASVVNSVAVTGPSSAASIGRSTWQDDAAAASGSNADPAGRVARPAHAAPADKVGSYDLGGRA